MQGLGLPRACAGSREDDEGAAGRPQGRWTQGGCTSRSDARLPRTCARSIQAPATTARSTGGFTSNTRKDGSAAAATRSRAKVFAKSDWTQAMQALVWSSKTDPEYLVLDPISYTDASGTLAGTARWLGSRKSSSPIFKAENLGRWRCIETRVRTNGANQSNGVFTIWDDGIQTLSRTAGPTSTGWVRTTHTSSTPCRSKISGTTGRRRRRNATSTTW